MVCSDIDLIIDQTIKLYLVKPQILLLNYKLIEIKHIQLLNIANTVSNNGNANNLAFGRPPVCVLRIGDFYNTKIIITSLTIDYDPLLWDLNQEGIGVMPMIANVTLQFNFIGGSDLGGPIQRLQNALSFNYYANASKIY